jgi:hypothetical protein
MSNYIRRTKNPKTGKFEDAEWLDDYYGKHQYGVRFPDGQVYREDPGVIQWEFGDETPSPDGQRDTELFKDLGVVAQHLQNSGFAVASGWQTKKDAAEVKEVAIVRLRALIDAAVVEELKSLPTLKWDGHEHCIDPHEVGDRIAARTATKGSAIQKLRDGSDV